MLSRRVFRRDAWRHAVAVAVAVAALAIARPAGADSEELFVMANVHNDERVVGGALTLGQLDTLGLTGELSLIGLEAFARWPITHRWSVRGILPLVHARSDQFDGTSLGNLTVGTTYQLASTFEGKLRRIAAVDGSVSLPTASSDNDPGVTAAAFATYNIADPGLYLPDTVAIRVAADFRVEYERLFAQTELSLHQLVIQEVEDSTLIRLGLGAGVILGTRVILLSELTTMGYFFSDISEEKFAHTLDVGVRVRTQTGPISVRLFLPLDEPGAMDQGIAGFMVQYQRVLE